MASRIDPAAAAPHRCSELSARARVGDMEGTTEGLQHEVDAAVARGDVRGAAEARGALGLTLYFQVRLREAQDHPI